MSFTINYKGTDCRGTTFLYACTSCAFEHTVQHPASEKPAIPCGNNCGGACTKKPTVPSLDADHHDSMKSHNLGWDTDG